VLPVVAKVIGILKVSAAREAEITQMHSPLVQHPVLLVQIGITVGPAANREFMQVRILPVHDGLNDPVEARQCVISGHLDAAPDCRSNFRKRQAELENPFEACHLSAPRERYWVAGSRLED